jgi:predicted nucleic acid-binding protein
MTEPLFVDTNVWVYAVDAADPAKRERALEVIAPTRGRELVLSTQVRLAVRVPASDAEAMVAHLSALPVVAVDASLVIAAMAGSREWQVSIWDALILRAAEVAGCRRLLSEDLADGATYGSVTVENPFASR